MLLKNRIRAAVLTVGVGISVVSAPSPSWASNSFLNECSAATVSCQTGTPASINFVDKCQRTTTDTSGRTEVCIVSDGDYVYVVDRLADGKAALGRITGTSGSVRTRWCRNSDGYQAVVRCNFDWVEGSSQDVWGGVRNSNSSHTLQYLWTFSG